MGHDHRILGSYNNYFCCVRFMGVHRTQGRQVNIPEPRVFSINKQIKMDMYVCETCGSDVISTRGDLKCVVCERDCDDVPYYTPYDCTDVKDTNFVFMVARDYHF